MCAIPPTGGGRGQCRESDIASAPLDDCDSPHPLSPDDGAIDHVLLTFGNPDAILGHAGFLRARPDIRRATVLIGNLNAQCREGDDGHWKCFRDFDSAERIYRRYLREHGVSTDIDFVEMDEGVPPFIRDQLHVVRQGDEIVLLSQDYDREVGRVGEMLRPVYRNDRTISDAVCGQMGYRCSGTPHPIDGGNMVAAGGFLFLGVDAFSSDDDRLSLDPAAFDDLFGGGLKGVIVGGRAGGQALYHIDMFVTSTDRRDPRTGRPIVVVGDMGLARRMLQSLPVDWLHEYEREWTLRFKADVAELQARGIAQLFEKSPSLFNKPEFFDDIAESVHFPYRNVQLMAEEMLDAHARELEEAGFHVVRIPLLILSSHTPGDIWYHPSPLLTYNNVLLDEHGADDEECRERRVRVSMPVYGIPELDEYAFRIYRDLLGYDVVPVEGFTWLTMREGSLRCSVQVLGTR